MTEQLHYYDEQVRRYLLQFIRMFSGFSVKTGKTMADGSPYYIKVPARYGDVSRMAATIIKGNSENIASSAPFIACYIQSLALDRPRMQEPMYTDTVNVNERKYDPVTQTYSNEQGNKFSVKRMMPAPYILNMQVDIWTSNTDQKLQLLEQILVLFNPALELQSINNPLDWTSITTVELTDVQWSSRSIPAGIEDQIDIASLFFTIPIWINPPAMVTRQNVIRTIIQNIYSTSDIASLDYEPNAFEFFNQLAAVTTVVVTPQNYALEVSEQDGNYYCKPLANGNFDADITWGEVLSNYGNLNDGTSRLRLKYHGELEELESDVIGVLHETDNPYLLQFELDRDTLPGSTIANINKVIDASTAKPGFYGLPAPELGQRYLCLHGSKQSLAWGINIQDNDIIEYNGSGWVISFDASENNEVEYVKNLHTLQQFKFVEHEWVDTFLGVYESGYWRLELIEE